MYPIEQFFEERGGGFTPDDIAFLARYGLSCLIRDSVASAGRHQEFETSRDTIQDPGNSVQETHPGFNQEKASTPSDLAGIQPEHLSGYKLGPFPALALGDKLPVYAIEGLYGIASSMARRVDCRVAVVNPWVGEEVLALLAGFQKNAPYIYCVGMFDGNASAMSKEMVDEYGPRTVFNVFKHNISNVPDPSKVRLTDGDAVDVAGKLDPQELHLLVIPPSEYGVEFDAFIPHCREDAIICGWGDTGVLSNKLKAIGVNVEPHSFWSIQARTYRSAVAKLQATGGPQVH